MTNRKDRIAISRPNGKYTIRAILDGKKKPLAFVDTLEEADKWIDLKLFGSEGDAMTNMLARTPLMKRKGRMKKDMPIIDYWLCEDMLATAPFKILVVETNDIPLDMP